jgi:hypothetical protein
MYGLNIIGCPKVVAGKKKIVNEMLMKKNCPGMYPGQ